MCEEFYRQGERGRLPVFLNRKEVKGVKSTISTAENKAGSMESVAEEFPLLLQRFGFCTVVLNVGFIFYLRQVCISVSILLLNAL